MQIESYWPLALGLILIAGFGSWVFIHSNRSYYLRWAVIPLSLIVAVASAKIYEARLGYSVAKELPPKFVYLGHQVLVERNHKAGIEVWAREVRTRLYRIPYSKPMEEALEQAQEESKSGLPVLMHRIAERKVPERGEPRPNAATQQLYESNIVLPSDMSPKNSG